MEIEKLIYEKLCKLENSKFQELNHSKSFNYSNLKIAETIDNIESVLANKGRYSSVLKNQLARHRLHLGEKFKNEFGYYNTSEILDIIKLIESGKLSGEPFIRHNKLKNGFMKIHHGTYANNGYSILKNIKNFWFKNKKIKSHMLDDFHKLIDEYGENNIKEIMYMMHNKAMINKAMSNELKGEWLIYKKVNSHHYFLCLAHHKEGDNYIYNEKIIPCINEFPELS